MLDSEVKKMIESSFFESGHCSDEMFVNSNAEDWVVIFHKEYYTSHKYLLNKTTGILLDKYAKKFVFSGNTGEITSYDGNYHLVPSENISGECVNNYDSNLCKHVFIENSDTSHYSVIVPEYQHEGHYLWNGKNVIEIITKFNLDDDPRTYSRVKIKEAIYLDKSRLDRYHDIPDYVSKENNNFTSDAVVKVIENGETSEQFKLDIKNPENYVVNGNVYYSTFEYLKLGTFFTCADELIDKFYDYYKSAEDVFTDGIKNYKLENGKKVKAIHDSFHEVYITNNMEVFKKCSNCGKLVVPTNIRVLAMLNGKHNLVCPDCFANKFGKMYGSNKYMSLNDENIATIHGDEITYTNVISNNNERSPRDTVEYGCGNCYDFKDGSKVFYLYDNGTDEDGVRLLGVAQHYNKTKKEAHRHLFREEDLVEISVYKRKYCERYHGHFTSYLIEKNSFEPYKDLFKKSGSTYYAEIGKVRV